MDLAHLDWTKIVLGVVAAIAGGFALRFTFRRSDKSTSTNQSGNIVKGDQAGRDINK